MNRFPLLLASLLLALVPLHADVAHDISETAQPRSGDVSDGDAYARSLYHIFTQNGVEAHLIRFSWQPLRELSPSESTMVVFRDAKGRYFGQQSTSIHAKWLSGTTPAAWVQSYYANAWVRVVSVTDNNATGQRLATR